jgi:hypothetical protein
MIGFLFMRYGEKNTERMLPPCSTTWNLWIRSEGMSVIMGIDQRVLMLGESNNWLWKELAKLQKEIEKLKLPEAPKEGE